MAAEVKVRATSARASAPARAAFPAPACPRTPSAGGARMFLARAAVDDARLLKDPTHVSPLLIRADVYDMLLRRPRRAGRVLRRASLHVRGLLRGVRPERGWQTPRRAQEARRPGGVPLEHRRHERRGPLPRAPFADKDIASNVSDEAFEAYLRAREK